MTPPQVVCLPGAVAPAAQRYERLQEIVADAAQLHMKDLELYRDAQPPPDYAIDLELSAIDRLAGDLGLDRFHLVGYSGGGFISLAYAGTRPHRVLSLGLFEPARIPGARTAEENTVAEEFDAKLQGLEGAAFLDAFVRGQLRPGVQPPPPPASAPSPEMLKRPRGIATLIPAFKNFHFDRGRFGECTFPVFIGYGDLSSEIQSIHAGVIARAFADAHVRRFAGVHHFVPPEQIYTTEHAAILRGIWLRGDERA